MFEMFVMMNVCMHLLKCRWITFGWFGNYGAKVSKIMHTVGRG